MAAPERSGRDEHQHQSQSQTQSDGCPARFFIVLGVRRLVFYVATAAAATVATLTLTGAVPQQIQITVTPTAAASGMNLAINQPSVKVADLNAQTNWPFGFTVTVSSENVTAARCTAPCFYSPSQTERSPSFSTGGRRH